MFLPVILKIAGPFNYFSEQFSDFTWIPIWIRIQQKISLRTLFSGYFCRWNKGTFRVYSRKIFLQYLKFYVDKLFAKITYHFFVGTPRLRLFIWKYRDKVILKSMLAGKRKSRNFWMEKVLLVILLSQWECCLKNSINMVL